MTNKINRVLGGIYLGSGYLAAFFLIAVLIFILTGISSRIFGFYIRGLAEYSGYSMAASSFFALAYTFYDRAHIRITLFLENLNPSNRKFAEIWCLSIATIFSPTITGSGRSEPLIISGKFLKDFIDQMTDGLEP